MKVGFTNECKACVTQASKFINDIRGNLLRSLGLQREKIETFTVETVGQISILNSLRNNFMILPLKHVRPGPRTES